MSFDVTTNSKAYKAYKAYILLVHIILIVLLVKTDFISQVKIKLGLPQDEITKHYRQMIAFHSRIDKNLPAGSVIFIGDSHVQGLAVSAVLPVSSVNYGIGNDTTVGVINRLQYYTSLPLSKTVVLAIGYNDLAIRSDREITNNIDKILRYIPTNVEIVLCAINLVGEKKHADLNFRINEINKSLLEISSTYENVTFLNSFAEVLSEDGYLLPDYHLPDNVHLSKKGYELWINKLRNAIYKRDISD